MKTFKKITLILIKNPSRIFRSLLNRIKPKILDMGNRFSTEAEVETLQKYAQKSKKGIVEIGVLYAGTTREIALYSKVPIYSIDPLISDSMDDTLVGNEIIIKRNMGFYKKFTFIKDYSFNVALNFNKDFDFLWIDGDHNYDACKKDFEDWVKLISPLGYIAFHDSAPVVSVNSTHKGYPGPIKLCNELQEDTRLKFIETIDSIRVFQKI